MCVPRTEIFLTLAENFNIISHLMKNVTINGKTIEHLWDKKLSSYVKNKIDRYKLVYRDLNEQETEQALIRIVDTLLDPGVSYSGPHRLKQWEKGWSESYNDFHGRKNIGPVYPHYFGKSMVNRLGQKFIMAISKDFQLKITYVGLDYIFDKYLRKIENIYDFGCGTGHNLLKVREVNKTANLIGLDWTKASQKILRKLNNSGVVDNLKTYNFDFFKPDMKIKIAQNSAIYTIGAIEQTGDDYKKFVSYLLKNKPEICLHIEPITELLDENSLLDYLSVKYYQKRNYLNGFLNYLRQLEKEGKIKIHETIATHLGSMFISGHSIIVWSPIN